MVDLSGESSNPIFDELASWEEVLKGSSLATPIPTTAQPGNGGRIRREKAIRSEKVGATDEECDPLPPPLIAAAQ